MTRQPLETLRRSWKTRQADARFAAMYRTYREFTMIPRDTFVKNLRLAALVRDVDGCVVECGVWRGGMIAAIADILGPDRSYFLFDSFEGLPPAQELDGSGAKAWQAVENSANNFDNCTADISFARRAMAQSSATDFELVQGWFDKTLAGFTPAQPIALLRLDADWYESTLTCLRALMPHLAEDAMVIVDDYHVWEGCARAVHAYLAEQELPYRIQQADADVCFMRKPKVA